jgi:shikimate kinase
VVPAGISRAGTKNQLLAERGCDYFRARERELLEELLTSREAVISTGGGAVLHHDVWQELKKTGLVIWLTRRLGNHLPASGCGFG